MIGSHDDAAPGTPGRSPTAGPQANQILGYWRILRERRVVVLACLTLVVCVTMTLTFLATPIYRAVTTIEIERSGPEILEFTDVIGVDPAGYKDFYQTQYMLLQSRTILQLAAKAMDLPNRPEFAGRSASPVARLVAATRARLLGATAQADPLDAATDFIEEGLQISPVRNSYLVRISFQDRDRALAAEVANEVAEAYKGFQFESRYETTDKARDFLTRDVRRVQDEIELLETELQRYATENELLGVGDGTQDLSDYALSEINARCVEAGTRLAAAEARHRTTQSAPAEALPEVLASPTIAHLRREFDGLERRSVEMRERFRSDWPPLIQIHDQMQVTTAQIEREVQSIAAHVRASTRNEFERLQAEFATLVAQRDLHKLEVQRVNRDNIPFERARAQIDSKRKVLDGLIGRQNETETSSRLKETSTSNIRVVDRAGIPKKPVAPRKTVNFLLSLMLGLTFGVGLAIALDYLDNSVKSEADLHRVGLAILGHVPLIPALRLVESSAGGELRPSFQGDRACHSEPRSGFAEAFRNLRTSLLLASPDHPPRSIAVTSCQPGDGKSTTAMNLAIVLTQLGRRVLLVDADLRRARLHKALDVPNDVGLSSFLSGNNSVHELTQDTEIPNLRVITSGPLPPNPSELLGSPRLDALLEHFRDDDHVDHVIFDSPPLLAVTDAMILSSRLDSTVVVVRAGVTRREALTQAVDMLKKARAPVVGSILNAVSDESGYYYGGSYRYGPYSGARYGYYAQEDAPGAGASKPARRRRRRAG